MRAGKSNKNNSFRTKCDCLFFENDVFFQSVTQAYSEKENPSASIRSRTYNLPITSSDALPLSYRRLVEAKAIKLGSWDKHPAYFEKIQL